MQLTLQPQRSRCLCCGVFPLSWTTSPLRTLRELFLFFFLPFSCLPDGFDETPESFAFLSPRYLQPRSAGGRRCGSIRHPQSLSPRSPDGRFHPLSLQRNLLRGREEVRLQVSSHVTAATPKTAWNVRTSASYCRCFHEHVMFLSHSYNV